MSGGGGEMMMMKSVFWWRKPEYTEDTTDLRQVTDETYYKLFPPFVYFPFTTSTFIVRQGTNFQGR